MICQNPECGIQIIVPTMIRGWFICQVCRDMLEPIMADSYWLAQHYAWCKEEDERRRQFNRLKDGGNYLESQ